MERELKRYFCAFASRMCCEGSVEERGELNLVKCQFWHSGASRCWFLPAMGALNELYKISDALETLASK